MKIQRSKLFYANIQQYYELETVFMDISEDKVYYILEYSEEEATVTSVKVLKQKLTEVMYKCESYQTAKANEKVIPKVLLYMLAFELEKQFYFYLSKIKKPSRVKIII